ncbi:MAG: AAA family ATPase [Candidatus Coatesbacteria bacterium]|nr:AAA family ATPase [Candidatus Coatesbacteria bacterium]
MSFWACDTLGYGKMGPMMIAKVTIEYFKRFAKQTFDLGDDVVLAGPNNSGKTTLLQAISAWNLGVRWWLVERQEPSKAKERTGVPVTRKDFTAIPLREMNLLWYDRNTAYRKNEHPEKKGGDHKLIRIALWGRTTVAQDDWHLAVCFRYANKEQVYVWLEDEQGNHVVDVPESVKETTFVHVPPFSGIGAEETGLKLGYQNMLVGQGKPGDILRNLLHEVYVKSEEGKAELWQSLVTAVKDLFGYVLLEPQYNEATDPFIKVEYRHQASGGAKFDIASAGSGFHQVLMLLSFFYARPASVLLLDEPDAHLHVILQRQVYDRLRSVARMRQCQLLVSTHSEVILEDTGPEQIISFYGAPHRLRIESDRDQVREALKRLSSLDILSAESGRNIFYVEGESGFKILSEFARILDHPMKAFFDMPFFYPMHGRNAREARAHFFGLKGIRPEIRAVLLLDGDNRDIPDHEIVADDLTVLRWRRCEIENYLLHPDALLRFVGRPEPDIFSRVRRDAGEKYLKDNLPPAALSRPLEDTDYLVVTPSSKTLLPAFLQKVGLALSKKDYFQIAAVMRKQEVHPEIKQKLDEMQCVLLPVLAGPGGPDGLPS